MAMQHWRGPRANSNRYEGWDSDRITQPPPIQDVIKRGDKWEFPRHHLKVFNILGEGCFGQVWRCEALDIDGKKKQGLLKCWGRKNEILLVNFAEILGIDYLHL